MTKLITVAMTEIKINKDKWEKKREKTAQNLQKCEIRYTFAVQIWS